MSNKIFAFLLTIFIAAPGNSYMDFNGSTQYLNRLILPVTAYPWMVTFWYRSTNSTGAFAFCFGNTATNEKAIFFTRSAGVGDFAATCQDVAGKFKLVIRNTSGVEDAQFCVPDPDVISYDGTWHFVAGWSNSSTDHHLFVDGVETSASTSVTFPTGMNSTTIGACRRTTVGSPDDADITDVRVYNKPLSTAQLTSLYLSRGRLNYTDGLVAWWRMDDGLDGTTPLQALDYSGTGNYLDATASPVSRAETFINYP